MFHLDNTSGVPEMPEIKEPQSNTPRWFGESVQQGGISWPGADWFNIVQAELLEILKLDNETPNKQKHDQIARVIQNLSSKFPEGLSKPDGQKYVGFCESISDLKLETPTTPGQRIFVKSYHKDMELGGGFFYYSPVQHDYDDVVFFRAGDAEGVWVREFGDSLTLWDGGAVAGGEIGSIWNTVHDALVRNGGGVMDLPPTNFTFSTPLKWDVTPVSINGVGVNLRCAINNAALYALNITSSAETPYGSPLENKIKLNFGFQLEGDGVTNAVYFDGTNDGKTAHLTFFNIGLRNFAKGVHFSKYTYMINFIGGYISRCKEFAVLDNAQDAGERISFFGTDFTSALPGTLCINNNSDQAMSFINCSFDWQYQLFYNKGQLYFTGCHVETPAPYMVQTVDVTKDKCFGVVDGTGFVSISQQRNLLNYNGFNLLPWMFSLKTRSAKLVIRDSHLNLSNLLQLATGPGHIALRDWKTYNEFSPKFRLTDNELQNMLNDALFIKPALSSNWASTNPGVGSLTLDSLIYRPGQTQSLKMVHKFVGQNTACVCSIPLLPGAKCASVLFSVYSTISDLFNFIQMDFLDSADRLVFTATRDDMKNTAGMWSEKTYVIDLENLGANLDLICKLKISFNTFSIPTNTQYNIGYLNVNSF